MVDPGRGRRGQVLKAPLGVPCAGETIAAKYDVEHVIALGGMGAVVAAWDRDLDRRVAVKFLLPEVAVRDDAAARFLREARSMARLSSEHAVRVYEVGTLEGGAPFMVMEHLAGADLADALADRGSLPIAEAVDYLLQACHAVAEAHSLGIVHRDLKPGNLFLARRPDGSRGVKVLDFGIAKSTLPDAPDQAVTATNSALGSPRYMAPEQVRNAKDVDARADIWSLGVVLHELLTDRPPFEADTVPAVCARIVADPPAPLRAHRPDAPAALEAVILGCLEKDRARRTGTVVELARALEPFASADARGLVPSIARLAASAMTSGTLPGAAATPAAGPAAGSGRDVPTQSVVTIEPVRRPAHGQLRFAAIAGVALAVGVTGFIALRSRPRPAPPVSASSDAAAEDLATPPGPRASAPPATAPPSSASPPADASASQVPSAVPAAKPARPSPRPPRRTSGGSVDPLEDRK